mgnify:FL=1|tara:strand:- start:5600 stop:5866 length:267 start_codon:yes stop_codon:yes gene_type:complete
MKKLTLNIASNKTKELIGYLSDLEASDRDRMTSSGKEYMDKIWKLLGLPTYNELPTHMDKTMEELEQHYDDIIASDFDENGTLIEEEE